MVKNDLILRNPMRFISREGGEALGAGDFGAVLARSGVGKTSFLVQLALDHLLKGRNVLHISLDQSVKKVSLWYEEVFRNISEKYGLEHPIELWETALPHRFIMTFHVGGFTVPLLEERLNDVTEQGIFFPQLILIDGMPFDEGSREVLNELKFLAREQNAPIWFSIRSHADEQTDSDGFPASISPVADMFEVIVQLQPVGRDIDVRLIKGHKTEESTSLSLDPATLLIKNRE